MRRYGKPSTLKNIVGALLLAATAWLYAVKVAPAHAADVEPVASEAEPAGHTATLSGSVTAAPGIHAGPAQRPSESRLTSA